MIGFFSFFGRAASMKALDQALRGVGLHPSLVPEAVKLTAIKILKGTNGEGTSLPNAAYSDAAELMGFCILGPEQFAEDNGVETTRTTDRRLESAIVAGDGPDANLIVLIFHSGLMVSEIADRFEIDAPAD